MILLWRIRFNLGNGEDRTEKQPRAVLTRDKVGVLALPTKTRALRKRLFHQRRSIDKHFNISAAFARQPLRELLQLAFDDIVIIAPRGISRNKATTFLPQQRDCIIRACVALAYKDRAARLLPQRMRMFTRVGAISLICKPRHFAVTPGVQKFSQSRACRPRLINRRDPYRIEPKRARLLFDVGHNHARDMAQLFRGVDLRCVTMPERPGQKAP